VLTNLSHTTVCENERMRVSFRSSVSSVKRLLECMHVRLGPRALMMAILATPMGCATLGGVTRRFDEVNDGPSRIRFSERLPTQDRVEVDADDVSHSAMIHVRLSRVLVCQVRRTAPRVVTRTTTRTANRVLFGAEMTLAIVGVVITGAAVSSAAKACPSGNPDTCDIGKATGWLAGVVTTPFLVSTVTDLALTGGTQRSTRVSTVDSVQHEYVEECGRLPASNVHAKLTLPDGEVLEQTSKQDGAILFELTGDQLARLGAKFEVKLVVDGASPSSTSIQVGE